MGFYVSLITLVALNVPFCLGRRFSSSLLFAGIGGWVRCLCLREFVSLVRFVHLCFEISFWADLSAEFNFEICSIKLFYFLITQKC